MGQSNFVNKLKDLLNNKRALIGRVVVPNDVPRDEYVAYALKTKTVCIRSGGAFFKNCAVVSTYYGSDDLVACAFDFPKDAKHLGSRVLCVFLDDSPVPIVIGGLPYGNTLQCRLDEEEQYKIERYTERGSYVIDCRSNGRINITATNLNGEGAQINVYANSQNSTTGEDENVPSEINYNTDKISFNTKENTTRVNKSLSWIVSDSEIDNLVTVAYYEKKTGFIYLDEFNNSIKVTASGVELLNETQTIIESTDLVKIEATEINLGVQNLEPLVLGDTLKSTLEDLITAIKAITVPTAMGTSGTPLNFADFDNINSTLSSILSDKSKLE